jgi:hypothetical protein
MRKLKTLSTNVKTSHRQGRHPTTRFWAESCDSCPRTVARSKEVISGAHYEFSYTVPPVLYFGNISLWETHVAFSFQDYRNIPLQPAYLFFSLDYFWWIRSSFIVFILLYRPTEDSLLRSSPHLPQDLSVLGPVVAVSVVALHELVQAVVGGPITADTAPRRRLTATVALLFPTTLTKWFLAVFGRPWPVWPRWWFGSVAVILLSQTRIHICSSCQFNRYPGETGGGV